MFFFFFLFYSAFTDVFYIDGCKNLLENFVLLFDERHF